MKIVRGYKAELDLNNAQITACLQHAVQPQEVVDKGPTSLAKRASIGLSCIYEKKRYEHSTKDGCLQTILPQ